jgi:hypothetical protein
MAQPVTVVGKGTYGCVVSPPLQCQGQTRLPTGAYLTKILPVQTYDKETATVEKLRSQLRGSGIHTRMLYDGQYCPGMNVADDITQAVEACRHHGKLSIKNDRSTIGIINYKNGGATLSSYYKKNLECRTPAGYANLFRAVGDILMQLQQLHDADIFHLDL